ncbi:Transcription factor GRAS [Canna indica]|uniref:Transcription factor GRAS n=1 Tax=Canna indica TaxID=4628 RepID=A0AAQ3KM56_9LILI|nr:Transcription factor GRAS [Canna indica]
MKGHLWLVCDSTFAHPLVSIAILPLALRNSPSHQLCGIARPQHMLISSLPLGGCATDLLRECAKAITESTGYATKLPRECANAIADKDSANIHRLKWMLNELASPAATANSFYKPTVTPAPTATVPPSIVVAEKTRSFDLACEVILKFQGSSPCITSGHVVANGTIMEAF